MTFEISTINIAVELFGILICLTVILCRNFLIGAQLKELRTAFTLLVFCEALLLFASAMTELLLTLHTDTAVRLVQAFYFQRYFFDYLLLGLFTNYTLLTFRPASSHILKIFTWSLVGSSIAALTLNLVFPFYYTVNGAGLFCRMEFYLFSQLPCVLIFLTNLTTMILGKKNVSGYVFISFLFYIIVPVLAAFMQIFFIRLDLVNIAFIIVLMHMFVVMQTQLIRQYIRQKRQLQESKTRMMMSQIKPHFLFNALTSIAQLCDDDPALAKVTTIAFADYLRGSLSSLDQPDTVPFRVELDHIKNYLRVESTRFGELLNVEYDIGTEDFKVPVLSIQPLVENAVKHGVGMKEEGGTVCLSAEKYGDRVIVRIRDDGVGFDPAIPDANGIQKGIGIRNSRERLKELCGAEMKIESLPGKGTEIAVLIPAAKCEEAGELL